MVANISEEPANYSCRRGVLSRRWK